MTWETELEGKRLFGEVSKIVSSLRRKEEVSLTVEFLVFEEAGDP